MRARLALCKNDDVGKNFGGAFVFTDEAEAAFVVPADDGAAGKSWCCLLNIFFDGGAKGLNACWMLREVKRRFDEFDFVDVVGAVLADEAVHTGVGRWHRQSGKDDGGAAQPGWFGSDGVDFYAVGTVCAPFASFRAAVCGVAVCTPKVHEAGFAIRC